ncbi:MAG: DUF6702 family protein [Bacteroidota bacterium]
MTHLLLVVTFLSPFLGILPAPPASTPQVSAITTYLPQHPFYVSICQIDYNRENESLEISLKLFIDDVEDIMQREGVGRLYVGESKEHAETNTFINRYLAQHFIIKVDGQEESLRFLGKEIESDAVWCYLEGTNIPSFSEIEIQNSVFMDYIESQVNIVHVKKAKTEKSLMFNKDKRSGSLSFD